MREEFLHFVWQHRLFEHLALSLSDGTPVTILAPGILNRDSGPDFSEARIKMDGLEWAGPVEIHIRASDWDRHSHTGNDAYANVILHVVWENDRQIMNPDGRPIPTLELQGRVSSDTLHNYEGLMASLSPIPCEGSFHKVDNLYKLAMLDRSLLERLTRKADLVTQILAATGHDWEETTYVLLAKGMGLKVNAVPFEELALRLPLRLLRKHADRPHLVEALLFGQAGLIPTGSKDPYIIALTKDWIFLQKKYGLVPMEAVEWKFHRLRPANFPTLRIAQLAAMVCQTPHLFNLVHENMGAVALKAALRVHQSPFWHSHFHFNKEVEKAPLGIGEATADLLIINVIAPLLHCYSLSRDTETYTEMALGLLEGLNPEKNRVTRQWDRLNLDLRSAADSQASLELYQQYCQQKRCLDCKVGYKLLRQ